MLHTCTVHTLGKQLDTCIAAFHDSMTDTRGFSKANCSIQRAFISVLCSVELSELMRFGFVMICQHSKQKIKSHGTPRFACNAGSFFPPAALFCRHSSYLGIFTKTLGRKPQSRQVVNMYTVYIYMIFKIYILYTSYINIPPGKLNFRMGKSTLENHPDRTRPVRFSLWLHGCRHFTKPEKKVTSWLALDFWEWIPKPQDYLLSKNSSVSPNGTGCPRCVHLRV